MPAIVDSVYSGYGSNRVQFLLTSSANACSLSQSGSDKANGQEVSIDIGSGSTSNIEVGTFSVTSASSSAQTSPYAQVEIKAYDATCSKTKSEASGGTVTVSSITASEIIGTFSVTSDNGTATGSFDAQNCSEPDGGISASTCAP